MYVVCNFENYWLSLPVGSLILTYSPLSRPPTPTAAWSANLSDKIRTSHFHHMWDLRLSGQFALECDHVRVNRVPSDGRLLPASSFFYPEDEASHYAVRILFLPSDYNVSSINVCLFCFLWRCGPTWAMASSFLRFLDHTQRRITVGSTPLDEWSARRRDLYLTIHNRQTSMPPVGFEPTISAGERPQTYALDRAATGTGRL